MLKQNYKTEDVKKALEILGAECFGAMGVCNSLGGEQSPEWEILNANSWNDIVKEALERQIDLSTLKCAVTNTPLLASATIQYALGNITEKQRKARFFHEVKETGKWKLND